MSENKEELLAIIEIQRHQLLNNVLFAQVGDVDSIIKETRKTLGQTEDFVAQEMKGVSRFKFVSCLHRFKGLEPPIFTLINIESDNDDDKWLINAIEKTGCKVRIKVVDKICDSMWGDINIDR